MPRKPREIRTGGIYHVIQRGVEKRKIFLKNQDYSRFILGLELFNDVASMDIWQRFFQLKQGGTDPPWKKLEAVRKERAKKASRLVDLLAFVLMSNHIHLVMREIRKGGISLFMRKMGGYSTYFNKQHDRVGPLFQSRFKSVEVENDRQLRAIFAYVHTNPVELWEPGWKERKVRNVQEALRKLEEYRWSSYGDYVGKPTFSQTTQRTLFSDLFGGTQGCREAVKEWVKYKAARTPRDFGIALE